MEIKAIDGNKLQLDKPLQLATIVNRPNRFIIYAELGGEVVKCHSPVSGRIGGLTLDGLPCLLSGPYEGRGTQYTVEAIALQQPTDEGFQWIGINQTRINSYVATLLRNNMLTPYFKVGGADEVKREPVIGSSRLDFLLTGHTYIEVKMPLIKLHVPIPATVPQKEFKPGPPSERFPKQMRDAVSALQKGQRVALIAAFMYANKLETSAQLQIQQNLGLEGALASADLAGLEHYKLDLAITPTHVELVSFGKFN